MKETSVFINEEQLISIAIDKLIETLGPVETNRFITLPRNKRVDSVERHQRWQASLGKDEFFEKIFSHE